MRGGGQFQLFSYLIPIHALNHANMQRKLILGFGFWLEFTEITDEASHGERATFFHKKVFWMIFLQKHLVYVG